MSGHDRSTHKGKTSPRERHAYILGTIPCNFGRGGLRVHHLRGIRITPHAHQITKITSEGARPLRPYSSEATHRRLRSSHRGNSGSARQSLKAQRTSLEAQRTVTGHRHSKERNEQLREKAPTRLSSQGTEAQVQKPDSLTEWFRNLHCLTERFRNLHYHNDLAPASSAAAAAPST